MNNPDNAMARPLSPAEEDRFYGFVDKGGAAERTLDAIKTDSDAAFTDLYIGEYNGEADLIMQALRLAAKGRDDAVIAAAVRQLLYRIVENRDAGFWREIDERARHINAAWHLSNSIASMACGLSIRSTK